MPLLLKPRAMEGGMSGEFGILVAFPVVNMEPKGLETFVKLHSLSFPRPRGFWAS